MKENTLPTWLQNEYSIQNTRELNTLTTGSAGKYWWTCSTCTYEWESRIAHRLEKTSTCPICSKKLLAAYPELVQNWGTKNTTTPYQHKQGSRERTWWKCETGKHPEYQQAIHTQKNNKTNRCPECAKTNPPITKTIHHKSPHLVEQWSTKNSLTPAQTYANSITKIIWECPTCHHEWKSRISYRTKKDRGCPKCANRLERNKTISEIAPQLMKEWSLKNAHHPDKTSVNSGKQTIWICPEKHEYITTPKNRTQLNFTCPTCALNKKSLATAEPKIAAEWHPTKNGNLTPETISRGSAYKAWWQCSQGHEWKVQTSSRTSNQTACPHCKKYATSTIETQIKQQLIQDNQITNITTETNHTLHIPLNTRKMIKVDIHGYYKTQPIVIEYDGWYWHSGQPKQNPQHTQQKDIEKTLTLLNNNYLVVRIREQRKNQTLQLLPITHPHLLQIHWNTTTPLNPSTKAIYKWLENLNKVETKTKVC